MEWTENQSHWWQIFSSTSIQTSQALLHSQEVTRHGITESQEGLGWRDLKAHVCHGQRHLQLSQVVQSPIKPHLEHIQVEHPQLLWALFSPFGTLNLLQPTWDPLASRMWNAQGDPKHCSGLMAWVKQQHQHPAPWNYSECLTRRDFPPSLPPLNTLQSARNLLCCTSDSQTAAFWQLMKQRLLHPTCRSAAPLKHSESSWTKEFVQTHSMIA